MLHDVRFSIPERELGKADIQFEIKRNGKKFGTLRVSKGSIVWFQKDMSYGHKASWKALDAFMKDLPRSEKR